MRADVPLNHIKIKNHPLIHMYEELALLMIELVNHSIERRVWDAGPV